MASCAFLAAGCSAWSEPADAARGPGKARYDLALRWHRAERVLTGDETVSFANTRRRTIDSVWFRLWGNGLGSCADRLIRIHVVSGGHPGGSAAECTARQVVLRHGLPHGKRTTVRLRFSERVPYGTNRFGHQTGGPSLLGNAIPILAVTDGRGTHLEPYSSQGEAGYSLAASWRVTLDLAPALAAATTGTLTAATDISPQLRRLVFTAPRARDFELAIGRMHMATTTAGGVRIRFFDELPDGDAATTLRNDTLAAARSDLLGYEQRFGPYAAPELDIVQTPALDGQGMEYPEIVFVEMTTATTGPASWADFEGLLAHEIAHQWFYGIVGNNQWREPWLDESFATFASGFPAHDCTPGDPLAGYASDIRLTSTMGLFEHRSNSDYYGGLYGGGACALQDLRAGFGAGRFDAFLRRWVDTHRFGVATTGAFIRAIRAAAPPGFDVDHFLRASRIDSR